MATEDVFPVIAEPTRRRILDALRPGDRSVGELVDTLGVSQPTVSKHLKVLREAGLVTTRADGQRRFYAVDPARFESAARWLGSFLPASAPPVAGAADVAPSPSAATAARPSLPSAPAPQAASAPAPAQVPAQSTPAHPTSIDSTPAHPTPARSTPGQAVQGQSTQNLGRTVGRTVEQVTGRAQDLLDRLPKPKFGRRR
jgi:DNA-binding transcriptional ArsR family regulator